MYNNNNNTDDWFKSKEKNLPSNSSGLIRVIYTNNFDQTGASNQILQVFSLNSKLILNGEKITMNNHDIEPKSLPIADENLSVIMATNDALLVKGFYLWYSKSSKYLYYLF